LLLIEATLDVEDVVWKPQSDFFLCGVLSLCRRQDGCFQCFSAMRFWEHVLMIDMA
jgi:hypothetical protein